MMSHENKCLAIGNKLYQPRTQITRSI